MKTRLKKNLAKVFLPFLVLAVGLAGAAAMYLTRDEPEAREPEPLVPLVRTMVVARQDVRMTVESQGTVSPRVEITMAPEVTGVVTAISPSLTAGGFFVHGEVLLEIDPRDFELAVEQARAEVARAELRLAQEEAEAKVALEEWKELGTGDGSPLALRKPQLAEARAALSAAKAARARAELDLERTRMRAPFAGRVRSSDVDIGQYVTRGAPVARIYAVDHAEVRLPIPDREVAYLDLPLDYRGEEREDGPPVVLRARFAGKPHVWKGRVTRTEGEIDPRSRMVHVVARVDDPYARGDDHDRPPLAVGMFVEAEIEGRLVRDLFVLPRTALRNGDRVLVIDGDGRLRHRDVEVYRRERETVYVRQGLAEGERLCLSPLEAVVDGMRVRYETAEER